jgi:hypothetical protein
MNCPGRPLRLDGKNVWPRVSKEELDWLTNEIARVPKNPEFEKPDLAVDLHQLEPATHITDGGSELPCQSDPRHISTAPNGVPTMLARSCLRSTRAFAGLRNGAVHVSKVRSLRLFVLRSPFRPPIA